MKILNINFLTVKQQLDKRPIFLDFEEEYNTDKNVIL